MSGFRKALQLMGDALFGAQPEEKKPSDEQGSIRALAIKRMLELPDMLDRANALVTLAGSTRQELKKKVAEAAALKNLGKDALVNNNPAKADRCARSYEVVSQTITTLTTQAQMYDQQAETAMRDFQRESAEARAALDESTHLEELERLTEMEERRQKIVLTQSTARDEFERAKDNLLVRSAAAAATAMIGGSGGSLNDEVRQHIEGERVNLIAEGWRKELEAGEPVEADAEVIVVEAERNDPSEDAMRFLDKPAFGGLLKEKN